MNLQHDVAAQTKREQPSDHLHTVLPVVVAKQGGPSCY